MAENRLAREIESREATQRVMTWKAPETLPMPDVSKHPGWTFRWIRALFMGQPDPTNMSAKLREGWEPCKAVDFPEMMLQANTDGRYKDNIEIGGLLLCKAPESLMKQRDAHYRKSANDQVASVDNSFLRQSDSRMPLFSEKKSSVSFGKGK
jgi:hypothetical protein